MARREKEDALGDRKLAPEKIREFELLRAKTKTFYDEISILSKKSPDGALNQFKVKFLNDLLVKVTTMLGNEFRPFPDFESFVDSDLPSASDAALILSNYLSSMAKYFEHHTHNLGYGNFEWHTTGTEAIRACKFP